MKKTYLLKKSNDNILGLLLIVVYLLFFYLWVNYFYIIFDSFRPGFYLAAFMFVFVIWIVRSVRFSYKIEMTNNELIIEGGLIKRKKRIKYTDIPLIKYQKAKLHIGLQKGSGGQEKIEIFNPKGRYFFRCSSISQQQQLRSFLNDVVSSVSAKAQLTNEGKIDYVNPLYKDKAVLKRNIGNKRQQRIIMWSAVGFVLFLIFILPRYKNFLDNFIINGQYHITNNEIYFWKTKIPEANAKTFTILHPFSIAKDSMHVFCRGKIVKNVDVESFRILGYDGRLYIDKNHLYGISPRLFPPPSELWVIEDVDASTLETVGEMYKDKNNLYVSYYKYPYIKKIDIPQGLDLASFRYLPRRQYADDYHIYTFDRDGNLVVKE